MILYGRIVSIPRRPWMFRSRYQPQRLLHDVMFGLFIASIALGITFFGSWAVAAFRHKEPCPHFDAKRGWGYDDQNRTCVRRPG